VCSVSHEVKQVFIVDRKYFYVVKGSKCNVINNIFTTSFENVNIFWFFAFENRLRPTLGSHAGDMLPRRPSCTPLV
jgi:hypothetical protein